MPNTYAKSRRGVWYPVEVPENRTVDLGEDWRDPVTNEPATGLAFSEDCPENPPEPEPVILHRSSTPPAATAVADPEETPAVTPKGRKKA